MKNGRLRVLHTSDWHLGQIFYDKKREEECEFFLNWLAETIKKKEVDCLLVAGDVFDTSTPSNHVQEIYFNYLKIFKECGCRHIVITSGNHDPAILLGAPGPLLKTMDIHVIGEPDIQNPENEVLLLRNSAGEPELVVCAVPFLREKYVRKSEPGESLEMKEMRILEGIFNHYARVAEIARGHRAYGPLPVIGMGHMFAGKSGCMQCGGKEKQLYVGNLGQVGSEVFDDIFDYVALGHLHYAQNVDEKGRIRYSGSPLPMDFGEAASQKSVFLIEFAGSVSSVETLPIPPYRRLVKIGGNLKSIEKALEALIASNPEPAVWVQVDYNGIEHQANLREMLDKMTAGAQVEVLIIRDLRQRSSILGTEYGENLEELTPKDVFERCLAVKNVPKDHWADLARAFDEVLALLGEEKVD